MTLYNNCGTCHFLCFYDYYIELKLGWMFEIRGSKRHCRLSVTGPNLDLDSAVKSRLGIFFLLKYKLKIDLL